MNKDIFFLLRNTSKLIQILTNLSPREKRILEMRFGLIDGRTHVLEEVGKEFGVTRERVRQMEARAIDKLEIIMKEDPALELFSYDRIKSH